MIELHARDGGRFSAYLAEPSAHNGGAVVILQEIFGINDNIRSVADSFAAEGFAAIAPDLFWRQEPGVSLEPANEADRERATALMKRLDQSLALSDALVAADRVRALPTSNGRVGAVGYCLGGKLAFLLAARDGIDAAVSYYGVAIQGALDQVDTIRCRLLLHIAAEDHLCPPDAQAQIAAAVSHRSDMIEVIVHPGVGHAFARRGAQAFDAAAAERADAATLRLLRAELLSR